MTDDATAGDNGAAVITIADNEPTSQLQALDAAVIDVSAAAEEGKRNDDDDDDEVEVIDDADTTAAANAQHAGTAAEQTAAPGRTKYEDVVLRHARNAKKLEEELQCVLCHDGLFKPVTATCGHSFCRVCLVESCLSRALDEAQCPVCRADVMSHFSENTPIVFHVNVTLWNLIQLLVPREEHKDYEHEEQEYTLKLDQLDAKWRIQSLRAAAEHFHREREGTILGTLDDDEDEDYVEGEDDEGDDDEDDSNDDDVDIEGEWYQDDDDEEGARRGGSFANSRRRQRQLEERRRSRQQRNRYPELKVENMVDGRLRVTRNVLLDTEDANEDGIISMRVGLALVEFPSILELYSEHQECSLAILKMEEDEEMDTGFPFFMNESGDDDALVISDYSNEITLKVFDDGGNNVMQRTRAARHGTVDFPHLRLDVPAGEYTFHFSDDLYGTYLTVKTQLRELHETNDAPLDDGDAYSSYVLDESAANDRSRRGQRRRQRTESDEEDANLQWDDQDSDDSFIVNDDDGEEEPAGAFSNDEDEEGAWEFHSDDEEVDEAEAQRLLNIRRAPARQRRQNMIHDMTGSDWSGREDQDDEDHEDDENDPELVSQDTDVHEHQVHDNEDDDDAVHPQNTSARRRNNSNRVVIDSDDDEGHDEQDNDEREEKHDGDDQDAEFVDHEEVVSSENADEASDADEGRDGERRSKSDRTEEYKESEDQQTSSSGEVSKEKTSTEGGNTRNEEPSYVDVLQSSEHEVTPVRPAKRTRARNIVLSENEDEEENEQEEKRLDRNDSKKQKTTHHVQFDDDEDNDEDMDDDTKYERMHPFLDEEREQLHEAQDADAAEQEEYFDYNQEDDDAEEGAFSENELDDEDPYTNEEDPFQGDEEETPFNNLDDGDGWD